MRVLPLSRPGALAAAAAALEAGEAVVFPTETFYALGADPRSAVGTDRVFELKRRPRDRPLPWIGADRAQVEALCHFGEAARDLADRFWPGPLTLVLELREDPARTVAVRVSGDAAARGLAAALGHPVISTSANLSGLPAAATIAAVSASLGPAAAALLALDGGTTPGGAPSVIVDPRGGEPRFLRGSLRDLSSDGRFSRSGPIRES